MWNAASIWQGFCDVRIWSSQQYDGTREYIHNNPVKRRLVSEAGLYPYSSAHSGFELDAVPQGLKPISFQDMTGTAEAMP
jgi:hypothetical protein